MNANQQQTLENNGYELIRSSWVGGNYRDYFSDGLETLEYRSETGLLHGNRNGREYEIEIGEDCLYELI